MPIQRDNLDKNLQASIAKVFVRVPTAAQVTATLMTFPLAKAPLFVDIVVVTTATGIKLAFDGGWSWTAGVLTVNNVGVVKWTAATTVLIAPYGPFTS